jgi:hypothetical protein
MPCRFCLGPAGNPLSCHVHADTARRKKSSYIHAGSHSGAYRMLPIDDLNRHESSTSARYELSRTRLCNPPTSSFTPSHRVLASAIPLPPIILLILPHRISHPHPLPPQVPDLVARLGPPGFTPLCPGTEPCRSPQRLSCERGSDVRFLPACWWYHSEVPGV